jgi:excisionase family DNA binding protein
MVDHEFLTTSEVAAKIGVARQTVDAWIRAGKLPARRIQVGKRAVYRIRPADFRAFVRRYVSGDW